MFVCFVLFFVLICKATLWHLSCELSFFFWQDSREEYFEVCFSVIIDSYLVQNSLY